MRCAQARRARMTAVLMDRDEDSTWQGTFKSRIGFTTVPSMWVSTKLDPMLSRQGMTCALSASSTLERILLSPGRSILLSTTSEPGEALPGKVVVHVLHSSSLALRSGSDRNIHPTMSDAIR